MAKVREAVIGQSRFGGRCCFCGLHLSGMEDFEVHHIDHDHRNDRLENLAPICELCHAVLHIDLVSSKWPEDSGTIILLPEMSQVELNNVMQATFWSMALDEAEGGPWQQANPHGMYARLVARSSGLEQVFEGLSEPRALARVLSGMSDAAYARRGETGLAAARYLPPLSRFLAQASKWRNRGAALSHLDRASWAKVAGLPRRPLGADGDGARA